MTPLPGLLPPPLPGVLPPLPPPIALATAGVAAPAPPLQTFREAEAGLSGCRGLAMPRPVDPSAGTPPLLAAWSLERGWGVMRVDGRLQRFALGPARRVAETERPAGAGPRLWSLSWRVGRMRAELRFPSERLGAKRWGGNGLLRLSSLATGDSYALPVRVEERC